jgi:D-3-phosphoglycerate dehydrogenase
MKPKVWMGFRFPPETMARIEAAAEVTSDGDMAKLAGSSVVVPGRAYVDGEFLDQVGPDLKLIAKVGIGVDTVDIPAVTERGILLANTPDAPSESTAEHAVALLLAIAKRVVVGDMQLRGNSGIERSHMRGTELRDRVLGVVGYGRIGRRVAEICALGLKMKVLAYDPYLTSTPPTPEGVQIVHDLETILTQADFLTLHTPLTQDTHHFIGERELRMLKPGSYLINASRGPVVDEAALIRALQDGHLAGAGLDVFDPEPPEPTNPLLKMINVVVTPHIASSTDRGLAAMFEGTADNILQVLKGERPRWLVNPEVWPGRMAAK